jgi:protease I
MKKSVLILTYSGYQDQELIYPYYRVLGAGMNAVIVADKFDSQNRVYGILGVNMPCNVNYDNFEQDSKRYLDEFSLLILPGGVKALEKLRQRDDVLSFISKWDKKDKPIASTCHGAQLLISSKIVKGRTISGYYSLKDDITNAGAIYSRDPVVIDKNIISSPHYDFMGEWMESALSKIS